MIRRLWPALVWALLILVLTGLPGSYFPEVTSFWDWLSPDKAVHVFIFGVQAYLVFYGIKPQYLSHKQRYLFVILATAATVLFGLATELLQRHVFYGRDGNTFDFLADAVGVFLGWLVYYFVNMRNIVSKNKS